nr:hypothetical protein [Tanacetum cinerariifolium]
MALIRRRFVVPIRRMNLRLEVRRSDAAIVGARNRCDCMAEFRARKLTESGVIAAVVERVVETAEDDGGDEGDSGVVVWQRLRRW